MCDSLAHNYCFPLPRKSPALAAQLMTPACSSSANEPSSPTNDGVRYIEITDLFSDVVADIHCRTHEILDRHSECASGKKSSLVGHSCSSSDTRTPCPCSPNPQQSLSIPIDAFLDLFHWCLVSNPAISSQGRCSRSFSHLVVRRGELSSTTCLTRGSPRHRGRFSWR